MFRPRLDYSPKNGAQMMLAEDRDITITLWDL